MRTPSRRLLVLLCPFVAFALLVAACGDDDSSTDAEADTSVSGADATGDTTDEPAEADADASTDESPAGDATADLQLATSDLGDILVDAGGNTLYLFVPDAQGDSTCYDQCEENWPVVPELATVGEGLDAALLGSTERTDGTIQATYNGWPLYRFANDTGPGDAAGQGVNDVWYVIDAAGDAIGAQ